MAKAIVLSILLHLALVAGLIWGDKLYLEYIKATKKDIPMISAALLMDKTYAPTDTAMRKGVSEKNLPPPKPVAQKKENIPEINKKKKTAKNILDQIRKEAREENRPAPKINNFPTHEKGEKNAFGTGGLGDRVLSPAEQALQAAMRKYFELEGAATFRKQFPNAKGYIGIKLVAVGNQFEIASLVFHESTGFNVLDRKCELAIRQALHQETFAQDVIRELAGKETPVICKP